MAYKYIGGPRCRHSSNRTVHTRTTNKHTYTHTYRHYKHEAVHLHCCPRIHRCCSCKFNFQYFRNKYVCTHVLEYSISKISLLRIMFAFHEVLVIRICLVKQVIPIHISFTVYLRIMKIKCIYKIL